MTLEQWLAALAEQGPITGQRDEAVVTLWLDLLANIAGGLRVSAWPKVRAAICQCVGSSRDTPIGLFSRHTAAEAAYLAAYAANAFDGDDTVPKGSIHLSSVALPAILAAAQTAPISGADAAKATLAAYAVAVHADADEHYRRGWHTTGTVARIAAAAGIAVAMRAPSLVMGRALSLAAASASGMRNQFGRESKGLSAAEASAGALRAYRLAAAGVDAEPEPFAGDLGFDALYGTNLARPVQPSEADEAILHARLKQYPAGVVVQAVIALGRHVADCVAHRPSDRIRSVIVEVPAQTRTLARFVHPRTEYEARLSVEHAATIGLLELGEAASDFDPATARTAHYRRLRRLITVRIADDLPMFAARMQWEIDSLTGVSRHMAGLDLLAEPGTEAWERQRQLAEQKLRNSWRDIAPSAQIESLICRLASFSTLSHLTEIGEYGA